MRILVVEDEPKTGGYLRKGLTESGYVVDLAVTGRDGLFQALALLHDLLGFFRLPIPELGIGNLLFDLG